MTKSLIIFLIIILGNTTGLAEELSCAPPQIVDSNASLPANLPQPGKKFPGSPKLQVCLNLPPDQRTSGEANPTGESFAPQSRQEGETSRPDHLEKIIQKYARQHAVEEKLVWAVIRKESGFNARAVSPKGAMGLMQLMPGTAAMLGVGEPFDPEQNIAGGVKYLKLCLNQFGQDVGLALAAYNAGPGNVVKYHGCPPFAETREYVDSVMTLYSGQPVKGKLRYTKPRPAVVSEVSAEPLESGFKWKALPPLCSLPPVQYKIPLPAVKDKSLLEKIKQGKPGAKLDQAKYQQPTNIEIYQE